MSRLLDRLETFAAAAAVAGLIALVVLPRPAAAGAGSEISGEAR